MSLIEALSTPTASPAANTAAAAGKGTGASGARARAGVVAIKLSALAHRDVVETLQAVSPDCLEIADKADALAGGLCRDAGVSSSDPLLYWPLRAHIIWQALESSGTPLALTLLALLVVYWYKRTRTDTAGARERREGGGGGA